MGQQATEAKNRDFTKILLVDCGIDNPWVLVEKLLQNQIGYLKLVQATDVILSEDMDFEVAILLCDRPGTLAEKVAARLKAGRLDACAIYVASLENSPPDIGDDVSTHIDAVTNIVSIDLFPKQVARLVRVSLKRFAQRSFPLEANYTKGSSADTEEKD